ncbi:hypothetical protein B5X24_HaOG205814 [Helicoverpa armigera]|nr:hypothetical protein B5X24_HaOG205814 [Helicoverpa armigera]
MQLNFRWCKIIAKDIVTEYFFEAPCRMMKGVSQCNPIAYGGDLSAGAHWSTSLTLEFGDVTNHSDDMELLEVIFLRDRKNTRPN